MNVLAIVYALFAALFFLATFCEGHRKRLPWDVHRWAGLAISLVWPAAVLVAFLSTRGNDAGVGRGDRRDES